MFSSSIRNKFINKHTYKHRYHIKANDNEFVYIITPPLRYSCLLHDSPISHPFIYGTLFWGGFAKRNFKEKKYDWLSPNFVASYTSGYDNKFSDVFTLMIIVYRYCYCFCYCCLCCCCFLITTFLKPNLKSLNKLFVAYKHVC